MNVVVLAGGFGTRLRGVVADVPKPMASVAGRPFLEILLSNLATQGTTRAIFSVGHMADVIIRHFGKKFDGVDLVYEIESQPLGTGGALRAAMKHCESGPTLVVNGDTFLQFDVRALMAAWQQHGRPLIVGREIGDASRYGRLVLEGIRVVGFAEKGVGGPGVINTGHYLLPTDIFDGFDLSDPFSIETDFFAPNIDRMDFEVFKTDGLFIDIGLPEDYQRAQTLFAGKVA